MPVAEIRSNKKTNVWRSGTWGTAPENEAQKNERLEWIKSYRGKYKGVFTPVDEFIRKRNSGEL